MKALVTAPICPLKARPDQASALADEALHGMVLDLLSDEGGGWYKARTHYGYTGYVHAAHLRIDDGNALAWSSLPMQVMYHKNICDVLSGPQVQAWPLLSLPRGALVRPVDAPADGWQRVALCDGREGYTRSSFLRPHRTTPSPGGEDDLRRAITETAMDYYGTQYRWGGKTPCGIDCSGLVFMAYLLNGVVIWRDAEIKAGYPIREIPRTRIKRADLLFFPGHVAMYLEDGTYLHATGRAGSDGVTINSLDPAAPRYRADLAEGLLAVGSLF